MKNPEYVTGAKTSDTSNHFIRTMKFEFDISTSADAIGLTPSAVENIEKELDLSVDYFKKRVRESLRR